MSKGFQEMVQSKTTKKTAKGFPNKSVRVMSLFLGLVVILAAFAGCGKKPTVEAEAGIAVEAAVVSPIDIVSSTVLKGKIEAGEDVSIIPKANGVITSVKVAVGDYVKAGSVICVLDSSDLQSQLRQAQASYNSALSGYNEAVVNRDRLEILYKEGAVSLQQVEQARGSVERSGLETSAASLQMVKDQMANCTVKATIDGVVAACDAKEGNMASPQLVAARIINVDKVKVKANITESNVNKIKEGQKVEVVVAAAGTKPFVGIIKSIAPAADPQSGTFPVEISISNQAKLLKPGMFGEAVIDTETRKGVLAIPRAALSGEDGVFVIGEDNKVSLVKVVLGLNDEDNVEIISGVTAGQKVVSTGQHLVYDGALVRVVENNLGDLGGETTPEKATPVAK